MEGCINKQIGKFSLYIGLAVLSLVVAVVISGALSGAA